jgi:translation initiation factor 2-alpha kinase 4
MNNPFIVRYHSSWIETDETHSFSTVGSPTPGATGSTFDTGTDPSAPLTSSTDDSTADGSDSDTDSDDSDSVVDFEEDSTPGAELDFEFGDDLDDMDFLSVGHDRSRSASYPQIHFGNDDDDDDSDSEGSSTDDASTSRKSPVLSRKGLSKKGTKPSTPTDSPRNKQVRTLYIQVRPSSELSPSSGVFASPRGTGRGIELTFLLFV